MPGFELFGDKERKEVNDVLDNGVLMRYGFDGMRNGHWKAKELEAELMRVMPAECIISEKTLNENVELKRIFQKMPKIMQPFHDILRPKPSAIS